MAISSFDLFKIGIGPSSSHTVGPMIAARLFAEALAETGAPVERVCAQLYGSLGATGRGHGTPKAVALGLMGETPDAVMVEDIARVLAQIKSEGTLHLFGGQTIAFDYANDIVLHQQKTLPQHANGLEFLAYNDQNQLLLKRQYYSVGGGFIISGDDFPNAQLVDDNRSLPYPFTTATELLAICESEAKTIAEVMLANEAAWRPEAQTRSGLLNIWNVMRECVSNGMRNGGILPGGLHVKRRAPALYQQLLARPEAGLADPLSVMDWVTLYAIAVNEENAAGGRVVTAPTNGAAGIIPSVLHYYERFIAGANDDGIVNFLLTAAAIGTIYKENASISGAEVGCQGEVGSACSMAAGALAAVLGGSVKQVENAAEIAMEHNLGLTCDPIGGLVQVPCIERNAMAAVKAITSARLALRGDGSHFVSLDKVIKTMRDTGKDMQDKYKETARGGLAVNVVEVPVNIIEC